MDNFPRIDDWIGIVAAVIAIILLPLSIIVVPFVMLFIPSSAAGPLALWPAILFVGFLSWIAKKRDISLLIR